MEIKKAICRSHRWHMLQRKEVQAHLGDTAGVIPDHHYQVSCKLLLVGSLPSICKKIRNIYEAQ